MTKAELRKKCETVRRMYSALSTHEALLRATKKAKAQGLGIHIEDGLGSNAEEVNRSTDVILGNLERLISREFEELVKMFSNE